MGGCGVATDGELKVIGVGEKGKRAANFIGEKRKRECRREEFGMGFQRIEFCKRGLIFESGEGGGGVLRLSPRTLSLLD